MTRTRAAGGMFSNKSTIEQTNASLMKKLDMAERRVALAAEEAGR